ncbi:MAG: DUF1501 domain-containing protein [Sediminibacterium sp.]|nr:DUF1501 domain-containing protein [Sediminibacterium sp.]
MNRSTFLKLTGTFIGGQLVLPHFLHAAQKIRTDSILSNNTIVFIQLNGGNDGLNTFIPYNDPMYYANRPIIAIPKEQVIRVSDSMGLHPNLKGLAQIQQDGNLWILQNVGYPQPNRSHFRSMEIWQTATASNEYTNYGWLGRYLDHQFHDSHLNVKNKASEDDAVDNLPYSLEALNIDSINNLALIGQNALPITISNVNLTKEGILNQPLSDEPLGKYPALDFVRKIAKTSVEGDAAIKKALNNVSVTENFPNTDIGNRLKWISLLIKGNLSSPIFYTSHSGYDTHDNQKDRQATLFNQLDQAVTSFYNELKNSGHLEKVTVVIFSEFGRRVKDNGKGTDHGTAAPMFVIDGSQKGKIIGTNPNFTNLDNGDLIYQQDFRSVYASLLKQKLAFDPKMINIQNNIIEGFLG